MKISARDGIMTIKVHIRPTRRGGRCVEPLHSRAVHCRIHSPHQFSVAPMRGDHSNQHKAFGPERRGMFPRGEHAQAREFGVRPGTAGSSPVP